MASRRKGTQLGGANRQQRSVGNVSGLASCQVWEAGSGHCGVSSKHLRKFRVGTLNVNTLRRRVCEVMETLSRRKVGLLHSGNQIPWWQLLHNQGQGHQVQALLIRKWQWHCWCRSVWRRRVDRESFWGSESFRQNHSSEAHRRPKCGYPFLSVYAPQSSGEFPWAVCCTGVGSNSIFCNGCKHWVHKKCSGLKRLKKRPWLQMYTVPGNCMPLGWQTTGGPGRTWQAWGGSFFLLPRRHALSSRWLWTFNHNTCENRLEEVQGSATSSLFTPPLFENTWPCVQLLCAKRYAPCQWDLDIDKAKPPASAAKWQGNDQTDLQCQAPRNCHHQIQWATCATWHWGWGPHSEGENDGMDMWNAPVVQSRQPLTYRLMESVGLGGPRWHGSSWQGGIAESGSSRISTLMIDVPGDLVWDLPCVQQASYLEGGPTDVDVCMLIKNPIMIWYEYIIIIKWYLSAINFLFITKENKTQTLFSVSFILLHFVAYIT